jgi:hypothetical protein
MKILVFLHGTTIMHRGGVGHKRHAIVRQVIEGEETVRDFASYVPIGNAVEKLETWEKRGAKILYLSSHRSPADVEKDKIVLRQHGFPHGEVFFRQEGEEYEDVADRIKPDILVEDDCESIGGEREMTYPHMRPESRAGIKSITVREFGGIDHLPGDPGKLLQLSSQR